MSSSKEAMIVVVISFLLVILLYSSAAKFDVFAKPTKVYAGSIACFKTGPMNEIGFTKVTCCQTYYYPNGLEIRYCTDCDNTNPPSNCGPRYTAREGSGNTPSSGPAQPPSTQPPSNETHVNNPTGNIGTVQPPSTPPPSLNAIPPPSALPSPTKQQTLTTTCPDGSAPDANDNCPTTTTNTNPQSGLTSNNNPQQGHNQKGNNQPTQTGGGQELTATKKHKGSKTDQATTQPPS